ncbi:5-oxoprolinase subunit PxpB [Dyella sp. 20L07]|uniref:5-oxoprolinase subunit PxpB n=1 Tax=Dyella sp. 20L07 TaxID=3384240 RepID=UPI003D2D09E3
MSDAPSTFQMEALAEDALLIRFGNVIDASINARVHAAARQLQQQFPDIEYVPAYASLLLRFDPQRWCSSDGASPHHLLMETILTALHSATETETNARLVDIPVFYGGASGPDLEVVAAHARLTLQQVIDRHSQATYRVAMLGFAPGFPYLLGLDPALAVPRRADPRLSVAAGSVAIGGLQTGVYPQALPGGWQVIGRTPLALFDLHASTPTLLRPGDRVRFRAIDHEEYERLANAAGKPA